MKKILKRGRLPKVVKWPLLRLLSCHLRLDMSTADSVLCVLTIELFLFVVNKQKMVEWNHFSGFLAAAAGVSLGEEMVKGMCHPIYIVLSTLPH